MITFAGPLAARVCQGLAPDETAGLQGILYQGWSAPSLLLRRPLSPNYLTYLADPGLPFTAVVDMSALVDPAQLHGHGLVYLPNYAPPTTRCCPLGRGDRGASTWEGLTQLYPNLSRAMWPAAPGLPGAPCLRRPDPGLLAPPSAHDDLGAGLSWSTRPTS